MGIPALLQKRFFWPGSLKRVSGSFGSRAAPFIFFMTLFMTVLKWITNVHDIKCIKCKWFIHMGHRAVKIQMKYQNKQSPQWRGIWGRPITMMLWPWRPNNGGSAAGFRAMLLFSSGGGVDRVEGGRIESLYCLFKMDPDEKSPLNGQNVKSSAL